MNSTAKNILDSCNYHIWQLDTADLAQYVNNTDDWSEVWDYGPQWSDAARLAFNIEVIRLAIRGEIADKPATWREDYDNDGNDYEICTADNSERLDTLHSLYGCAEAIERDPSINIWYRGEQIY